MKRLRWTFLPFLLATSGLLALNWQADDGDLPERFSRVHDGMTLREITEIMGRLCDESDLFSWPGFIDSEFPCVWHGGRHAYAVKVGINGDHYLNERKIWDEPPIWEKAKRQFCIFRQRIGI